MVQLQRGATPTIPRDLFSHVQRAAAENSTYREYVRAVELTGGTTTSALDTLLLCDARDAAQKMAYVVANGAHVGEGHVACGLVHPQADVRVLFAPRTPIVAVCAMRLPPRVRWRVLEWGRDWWTYLDQCFMLMTVEEVVRLSTQNEADGRSGLPAGAAWGEDGAGERPAAGG